MTDTLELSEQVRPEDEEGMHALPPPFEGVKWRVKIGDREYGPYPRSRLIDFLKEGRVTASTFLCCGNDRDYHRADHHPNLRWDFKAARRRKFGDPKLEPGESEVPVCNYFIAARLVAGNDRVEKVLREAGKMTRASGDMWVLRSRLTVQQLRNHLTMIMKPHEHFIIVNASKDRLAWFNIGVENDVNVRSVWDSDEVA
jgi:hypothetical protein